MGKHTLVGVAILLATITMSGCTENSKYICQNSICEADLGENTNNCPQDCGEITSAQETQKPGELGKNVQLMTPNPNKADLIKGTIFYEMPEYAAITDPDKLIEKLYNDKSIPADGTLDFSGTYNEIQSEIMKIEKEIQEMDLCNDDADCMKGYACDSTVGACAKKCNRGGECGEGKTCKYSKNGIYLCSPDYLAPKEELAQLPIATTASSPMETSQCKSGTIASFSDSVPDPYDPQTDIVMDVANCRYTYSSNEGWKATEQWKNQIRAYPNLIKIEYKNCELVGNINIALVNVGEWRAFLQSEIGFVEETIKNAALSNINLADQEKEFVEYIKNRKYAETGGDFIYNAGVVIVPLGMTAQSINVLKASRMVCLAKEGKILEGIKAYERCAREVERSKTVNGVWNALFATAIAEPSAKIMKIYIYRKNQIEQSPGARDFFGAYGQMFGTISKATGYINSQIHGFIEYWNPFNKMATETEKIQVRQETIFNYQYKSNLYSIKWLKQHHDALTKLDAQAAQIEEELKAKKKKIEDTPVN